MITDLWFFTAFLMGLAGSVHCVGMCGGVATALTYAIPKGAAPLPFHLMYNLGRLFSYTLAGALVGLMGMGAREVIPMPVTVLGTVSGFFLVMLAAYLGQWWNGLSYLERLGQHAWRFVSPFAKRFIPFTHPVYALPYGVIWGWLPCGLVYSALTWSVTMDNPLNSSLVMLAFGLGTLPSLITAGLGSSWLKQTMQHSFIRQSFALLILCFGIWTLYVHLA